MMEITGVHHDLGSTLRIRQKFTPYIDERDIKRILLSNYNLIPSSLRELDAYEDLNIYVQARTAATNPGQETLCNKGDNSERMEAEFVLKLTVLDDVSSGLKHIESQEAIVKHVRSRGVPVPATIATTANSSYATVWLTNRHDEIIERQWSSPTITSRKALHVCLCNWKQRCGLVRVIEYIRGMTLLQAENPVYIMSEVGRLVGRMDSELMGIELPEWTSDSLWNLTKLPELEPMLEQYCSQDDRVLGMNIIFQYQEKIVPILQKLQRGVIHGDVNNCNILVQPADLTPESKPRYNIAAIIDFGDACSSFYVYEISVALADLMTSCQKQKTCPFLVANKIIHGYLEEFQLQDIELDILKLCVCIRLLQLYILSASSLKGDPHNQYIALELKENLETLKLVWNSTDEDFKHSVLGNKQT